MDCLEYRIANYEDGREIVSLEELKTERERYKQHLYKCNRKAIEYRIKKDKATELDKNLHNKLFHRDILGFNENSRFVLL
jgi:hypothetical protein